MEEEKGTGRISSLGGVSMEDVEAGAICAKGL